VTVGDAAGWREPGWRRAIETWAAAQLAVAGLSITGPIGQPHVRPRSTALRVPTDGGIVWCKAARPGTAHEVRLLTAFAAWGVRSILRPIGAEPERGCVLD
jgi:hypothetical protein